MTTVLTTYLRCDLVSSLCHLPNLFSLATLHTKYFDQQLISLRHSKTDPNSIQLNIEYIYIPGIPTTHFFQAIKLEQPW